MPESEGSCRQAHELFRLNEDLMVFLFSEGCGSLVDGSGLHDVNWELGYFGVGYWGRTCFCGKELITEGVTALSEYALNHLCASRVFLTTDEFNTASWRLAVRAGFDFEGTLRNDRRNLQGNLRNTRIYSKIPKS